MTVEEIRRRVARITDLAGGTIDSPSRDASAHEEEDKLYLDTLRAIADGAPNPTELAREAMKAGEVKFSRWYE